MAIAKLLTSDEPKTLRLKLNRLGAVKDAEFRLETAASVLALNHKKVVKGDVLPDFLDDSDLAAPPNGDGFYPRVRALAQAGRPE